MDGGICIKHIPPFVIIKNVHYNKILKNKIINRGYINGPIYIE